MPPSCPNLSFKGSLLVASLGRYARSSEQVFLQAILTPAGIRASIIL